MAGIRLLSLDATAAHNFELLGSHLIGLHFWHKSLLCIVFKPLPK